MCGRGKALRLLVILPHLFSQKWMLILVRRRLKIFLLKCLLSSANGAAAVYLSEVVAVPFFLPPPFYSILQSHWTTNKVTMKVMIKEKESNKAKLTITQSVPCIPVRNPLRADNKYDNYTAISNTVLDCGWLLEHQVVQLRVKQLRGYECVTGFGAPPS